LPPKYRHKGVEEAGGESGDRRDAEKDAGADSC
jgi:hypothetical protein